MREWDNDRVTWPTSRELGWACAIVTVALVIVAALALAGVVL